MMVLCDGLKRSVEGGRRGATLGVCKVCTPIVVVQMRKCCCKVDLDKSSND